MIDLKVAQAIQQDYRQAAANHRFVKEHALKSRPLIRLTTVTPAIALITLMILFS